MIMKKLKFVFPVLLAAFTSCADTMQQQQPNVLWVLTDDHRYDAVRAFNEMLHGCEMSELGYVESPNIDRLADMGTTFINTWCQAQGCAPSRASMHMGRYPFRSGIYEFEYFNNNAEHCRPTLPEQMADLGYQTLHIGKLGVRIRTIDGDKVKTAKIYQTDIDFKQMRRDGFTGWGKDWFTELDGKKLDNRTQVRFFVSPDGSFEYVSEELEESWPEYKGTARKVMEKYNHLRHYNKKKPQSDFEGSILAGVSSQPAGKTRDGYYNVVLSEYLDNTEDTYTIGSQTVKGIDPSKPLFCHLGYDFPHTPVLPPANYRERFQEYQYKVPEFDKKELETMPAQLKKQVMNGYSDHFSDEEKQAMIQDYYAFCAYGDDLVGKAVDDFIAYSEKQGRPWLVVYVHGDHGWKLNDHGAVAKFTPWKMDAHNPIIVVSSDNGCFPAGKVVTDYTEFVDVAPTILAAAGAGLDNEKFSYLDGLDLAEIAAGKAPVRDYVIGESHAVTGPRAFIRTEEYMFSMKTRPNKNRGEYLEWALNAGYEELDPGLYHTKVDPYEINNLAFDKEYEEIAMKMKDKLMNIVLGDNRVEVDWGPGTNVTGTDVHRSNFAPGAHDYMLKLPSIK